MRSLIRTLLIALLTFGVPVAILELAASTSAGDIRALRLLRYGARILRDSVDHRNEPHQTPAFNSDGLRSHYEPDDIGEEDFSTIFLGDSFVYGVRLKYQNTLPFRLEEKINSERRRSRVKVINFGWLSSSPVLSYRLLKDIGKKYKPDLVLLGLDMVDFYDDLLYSNIINGSKIFALKKVVPGSTTFLLLLLMEMGAPEVITETIFGLPGQYFFVTNQPLEKSRPSLTRTTESLEQINEFSRKELNASFVLLVFPRHHQYSRAESPESWQRNHYEPLGPYVEEPFVFFEELKRTASYPIVSLLEDFKRSPVTGHTFVDDPHWNAKGVKITAEAILEHCRELGCFP